MTSRQTAETYDKLAAFWSGEELDRSNGIAQHRRALQFTKTHGSALDIGCGSSGRIVDLLLSEGFEVEGLDISAEMLRLAKQRHPDVVFHLADIVTWEPLRKYDFISAWDSIWHVPLTDQEAVLQKLCGGLNPGGVLIFTTGGVDEPGEVANPFMGEPLYHASLGIPKLLEIIAREGCVCRHLEHDQFPEPHVYFVVRAAKASHGR